jgi:hypothetical protein
MFEPTELKLVIDRVLQPVFLLGDGEQRSHDVIVDFTTADESFPPLSGIVRNKGVCHPVSDTVLQARYTGGILAPQDPDKLDDWRAVFGQQSQKTKRTFWENLRFGLLRLMFGLVPPQAMNFETGEVKFIMERSPKGSLEILYIDEELRITRGERGTVLVFERQ